MAFLPDGCLLVTEKRGALKLYSFETKRTGDVAGVPVVENAGQGGLGDVVLHPEFGTSGLVYLSYAEAGERGTAGAAVARARLALDAAGGGRLEDVAVIWRQTPKVDGRGHYGHRIAFGRRRTPLYQLRRAARSSRRRRTCSRTSAKSCGSTTTAACAADNPFADRGGVAAQIWSLGHRNPARPRVRRAGAIVERRDGAGGRRRAEPRAARRELRLSARQQRQPLRRRRHSRSRHAARARGARHVLEPVISPSSLLFYSGSEFPDWQGDAFIGGLSSTSLVRIEFGPGGTARGRLVTGCRSACVPSSRAPTAPSGRSRTGSGRALAEAHGGSAEFRLLLARRVVYNRAFSRRPYTARAR